MKEKRVLLAIGGNSLIKDSEHLTVDDQYAAICETAKQIADIIACDNKVVITHGNGPQVGFILRRSEIAFETAKMHTVPLVSCDADTQGAIGYQIQQALDNEFRERNLNNQAVTIITQVLVNREDEAFSNPSKPIGSFYTQNEYEALAKANVDWTFIEDAGRGYRRVVASPSPIEIIELDAIRSLYDNNFSVIAAGGGGIPVIKDGNSLKGVDAVIDKDQASALLATVMDIETLIISTGVTNVALNFMSESPKPLHRVTLKEIKNYLAQDHFAKGSMKPKIEAAVYFLEHGGTEVIITDPQNLSDAFFNNSGTHITKE